MEKKTASDLRAYLSTFEAQYPIKKGYITRLILNENLPTADICRIIKGIVQTAESHRQLNEKQLMVSINKFFLNAVKKVDYSQQWVELLKKNQEPFTIPFKSGESDSSAATSTPLIQPELVPAPLTQKTVYWENQAVLHQESTEDNLQTSISKKKTGKTGLLMMAKKTLDHLRAQLSMFKAEYPIQKGYIARLMIVEGRSARGMLSEIGSIVQAAEPGKQLHEGSFSTNAYALKRLIMAKSQQLTEEWPSLIKLLLQRFPITFKKLPNKSASPQPGQEPCLQHTQSVDLSQASVCETNGDSEVTFWKAGYKKNMKVSTSGDTTLDAEQSDICNYVSSYSLSHIANTSTDIEADRTVMYNSHRSISVRDNVLSDRASSHQIKDSKNMAEDICFAEDVRPEEAHKDPVESVIVIDFQAMMAGVKGGSNKYSEDFHQGHKTLLEPELPACEKTSQCQKNDANIVLCGRKYLDKILINKFRKHSGASQKSVQPSVLHTVQLTVAQSVQPSVAQSIQPSVLQSVQPSVAQSVQPSVAQSVQPSVAQSVQPSVVQSVQPSVVQSVQPSVVQLSVVQSVQPSVMLSYKCKFCHHELTLNSSLQEVELVQSGLSTYKCSTCGNVFRLDTALIQHTKDQTENKSDESVQLDFKFYKCDVCGCIFQERSSLQKHRIKHLEQNPYKCDVCGREFAVNYDLQNHIRTHTRERPFKCDVCGRGFDFHLHLKVHMRTHTGEKLYKCHICGRGFDLNSRLKVHMRTHTGEKPYKCDLCGRGFSFRGNLNVHQQTHSDERPYQCDACGLTFNQRCRLMKHTKIHLDGNIFKCNVCCRIYKTKSYLILHTKLHTGEKLHKCNICSKRFLQNSNLNAHKRLHTEKRPYQCDVCGATFKQLNSLNSHKIIHTGEKHYVCDVCGKSFSQNYSLKVHKRIHTQERPFKCDVCGATFIQSSGLNTHKIIHTGEKHYVCDICGFRVNRKDNLKLHKKIH